MIGKLKGIVDFINTDHIVLDVSGVGYVIHCSSKVFNNIKLDCEAEILIQTIVREDGISLYGFLDRTEKTFFNHLIKIPGVGPKLAMTIVSSISPTDVTYTIQKGESELFLNISGVGKKLATRILNELKDKNFFTSNIENSSIKNLMEKNSLIILKPFFPGFEYFCVREL